MSEAPPITGRTMRAVFLTVPKFPVHRRTVREWVAVRCEMADQTFTHCLSRLTQQGHITRGPGWVYQQHN